MMSFRKYTTVLIGVREYRVGELVCRQMDYKKRKEITNAFSNGNYFVSMNDMCRRGPHLEANGASTVALRRR